MSYRRRRSRFVDRYTYSDKAPVIMRVGQGVRFAMSKMIQMLQNLYDTLKTNRYIRILVKPIISILSIIPFCLNILGGIVKKMGIVDSIKKIDHKRILKLSIIPILLILISPNLEMVQNDIGAKVKDYGGVLIDGALIITMIWLTTLVFQLIRDNNLIRMDRQIDYLSGKYQAYSASVAGAAKTAKDYVVNGLNKLAVEVPEMDMEEERAYWNMPEMQPAEITRMLDEYDAANSMQQPDNAEPRTSSYMQKTYESRNTYTRPVKSQVEEPAFTRDDFFAAEEPEYYEQQPEKQSKKKGTKKSKGKSRLRARIFA